MTGPPSLVSTEFPETTTPSQTGRFITFEGGEGAGKSTQLCRLAHTLRARGLSLVVTREPGGCPVSECIRHCLVRGQPEMLTDRTELLLVLAARIEHVRQVIHPALQQGTWVLCDRFIDSTLAYQGHGRGMDEKILRNLHTWALEETCVQHPDLTVLLDVPPAIGLARAARQDTPKDNRMMGEENRFERETLAFHQRVQDGFHALAKAAPDRFRIVDATQDPAQVEQHVWRAVCHVFPDA